MHVQASRMTIEKTTAIKPFNILKCQAWLAQKVSDIKHVEVTTILYIHFFFLHSYGTDCFIILILMLMFVPQVVGPMPLITTPGEPTQ